MFDRLTITELYAEKLFDNEQNTVVTKLFDYLHKSLEKETEIGDMEVHNLTQYT